MLQQSTNVSVLLIQTVCTHEDANRAEDFCFFLKNLLLTHVTKIVSAYLFRFVGLACLTQCAGPDPTEASNKSNLTVRTSFG